VGDGAFVEFRSAVNAVQSAIELQDAMAKANAGLAKGRIVLRIGINLGDVMVEGGDLYGDGINVAPTGTNGRTGWQAPCG
jgi:adenylate cyclase